MLDLLRDQPDPLSLAALVKASGLHENTLREHLEGLLDAELVRRTRATPQGRGRPAWLYAATEHGSSSEYASLASALAATVARTASDPAAAAAEAGEAWGRDIARRRHVDSPTPARGRAETLRVLDEFGFAPVEVTDEQVDLTRCPLLEAAHQHPEVVCAVHLGLVRGVMEEYGADPSGSTLVPFAAPGACSLVLPLQPPA